MSRNLHAGAALLLTLLIAGAAGAAGRFDGEWDVGIVVESGDCDSGYLLPIKVSNGAVSYNGQISTTAKGTISDAGKVDVKFVHDKDEVTASGQISGTLGRGKWTSATLHCTGRWEANKR